jgi:omega-6 fatty acid desaturase (delta-12 desaturase)
MPTLPAELLSPPAVRDRDALAPADWKRAIEPYVGPDSRRAALQVATTFALLAIAFSAMYLALNVSILLVIAITPLTAGLLVRTFIIMHDCAHGSLFESRRMNDLIGYLTGVLTLTPFDQWRRDHALHHASSGDLDRRGHGDVPTITVREYKAKPPRAQFTYRLIRHPASLMFVGPIHLMVGQRLRSRSKATKDKQIASVWRTNAGIAALLAITFWAIGWEATLLVYGLPIYLAAMAGIWLFYVQHQFEDAYWESHDEWDYVTAALRGSSHLKLPAVFQWFTGSIGLHHIHHLSPRIPNYRLQRCHDDNVLFQSAPEVTFRSGMAALRLALWDEDRRRMVRFDEL